MRKQASEIIKEQSKMLFDLIFGVIIAAIGAIVTILLNNLLLGGIIGGTVGTIAMFVWKRRKIIKQGLTKAREIKENVSEMKENPKDAIIKIMLSKWSILPENVKEKLGEAVNLKQQIDEQLEKLKDFQYKTIMVQLLKVRKQIRQGIVPDKKTLEFIQKQAKIGGFTEIEEEIAYLAK
jgi:F0F1-type ATP synthase membrane subunit b/b'